MSGDVSAGFVSPAGGVSGGGAGFAGSVGATCRCWWSTFLEKMGTGRCRGRGSTAAMRWGCCVEYGWPGNVRELMHVMERGAILAGDKPEIGVEEVRLRKARRKES